MEPLPGQPLDAILVLGVQEDMRQFVSDDVVRLRLGAVGTKQSRAPETGGSGIEAGESVNRVIGRAIDMSEYALPGRFI